MPRHVIVIFFKLPAPGKVKTRLAPALGADGAAAAYEELAARTLSSLHAPQEDVAIWIAFDPPDAAMETAAWLRGNVPEFQWHRLHPQPSGDLGARLWNAVEAALVHDKADSVTLVGTDCPRLTPEHFMQARTHLAQGADMVFGPATDGGYYLQAMKTAERRMFDNIPWSSPETLRACLNRAGELGLRVALLGELSDVDTPDDWAAWRKELSG